jgi:hypothetical protein
MDIEKRLEGIEKRLSILEDGHGLSGEEAPQGTIELDLTLPGAEIGGLRFNKTEVHAVFEKGEDGWYQSRDILFLSARNTEDDNSRDILSEYLQSEPVQNAFLVALYKEDKNIEISLPKESVGVKRYNGVDCWYWLADPYAASSASFACVNGYGYAIHYHASGVGGCAPLFRVA